MRTEGAELQCEMEAMESIELSTRVDVEALTTAVDLLTDALALHRAGRQREALRRLADVDRHRGDRLPAWFLLRTESLRLRVNDVLASARRERL